MNILVTGGGGFIGSHLVDLLLEHEHFVTVLDNFSTGKCSNLPQVHSQLQIIEGDIRNADTVSQAADDCDAIVHLAAVASVQASVDDPIGTHEVNLIGTVNLLEAAKQHSIKRFVFASSAAVYGNTEVMPVSETTSLSPLTPYAADKLASEYYIDFYRRQYGCLPAVFRFFNIFGSRQDPSSPYSGVISIFMQRAINNQPITVFGDGEQSRDFVYVADLVQLLADAVEKKNSHHLPMNVGNGSQTNLNQLLDLIREFSENKLDVSYVTARPGDIRHSLADNTFVRKIMSYQPQYSVASGLKITYDWYLTQNRKILN
ncbi:MAG: NAD-dependent epimerase/dehydratase family protein [Desulfuromusa sp.]|nr:NAD-dependent epimerase/dehydratase family protein [Desulfuromusa sp.]